MTENESLLEYCERAVKTCVEECGGACSLRIKECECVDANVLKHLRELEQYRAIGTIEEFKYLKEKNTEVLLKDGQLLYQQGLLDGYIKAIDEFAERLKTDYVNFDLYYILEDNNFAFENTSLKCYRDMIDEIAEQMKGGE